MTDLKAYFSDEGLGTSPDLLGYEDCRKWSSDCKCSVCRTKPTDEAKSLALFEDYNHITIESTDELTTHQYFLCHYEMMSFIFRTRTWGKLLVHLWSVLPRDMLIWMKRRCTSRISRNPTSMRV